jgi:hypothetical protein
MDRIGYLLLLVLIRAKLWMDLKVFRQIKLIQCCKTREAPRVCKFHTSL